MGVTFDPDALITITQYEEMTPQERDDYDRAHMLHDLRTTDSGRKEIETYGLENAEIDEVVVSWNNEMEVGAVNVEVARTWLIGRYITEEAEQNPDDWPGGPPPVG